MAEKKQYIHYGSDHFNMEKFKEIQNKLKDRSWQNKPNYGLWASPVDAEYSWADWCKGEGFHTELLEESFTFTLTDDAKVLTVRSLADVENYIRKMPVAGFYSMSCLYHMYLDFNKIMRDFDAMEVIHGDNYSELHDDLFYLWDVDSIVIWNPDIIIF